MRTLCLSLLITLAVSVSAADNKIPAGYNAFQTVGGGATHIDFAGEPIPADFFCIGADAYKGRIDFEGAPLATDPPGMFVRTDTIVERIDDAVFDENGTAFARVRVEALNLVSREPIVNDCGVWDARVGVTERQPLTTMDFHMINAESGTFSADLVLTVRFTFTNRDNPEDTRALERTIHFTEFEDAPYVMRNPQRVDFPEIVRGKRQSDRAAQRDTFMVDSDADGIPDKVMRNTNTSSWWQVGSYACPWGIYPPNPRCILWEAVHYTEYHVHLVIPIAPKPTDSDRIDSGVKKTSRNGLIDRAVAVDDDALSELQIMTLRERFQILEDKGLLKISAEELLDETISKNQLD